MTARLPAVRRSRIGAAADVAEKSATDLVAQTKRAVGDELRGKVDAQLPEKQQTLAM